MRWKRRDYHLPFFYCSFSYVHIGSLFLASLLHRVLSTASSPVSPLSLMASLIQSFHLLLGLPHRRLPATSTSGTLLLPFITHYLFVSLLLYIYFFLEDLTTIDIVIVIIVFMFFYYYHIIFLCFAIFVCIFYLEGLNYHYFY